MLVKLISFESLQHQFKYCKWTRNKTKIIGQLESGSEQSIPKLRLWYESYMQYFHFNFSQIRLNNTFLVLGAILSSYLVVSTLVYEKYHGWPNSIFRIKRLNLTDKNYLYISSQLDLFLIHMLSVKVSN